MNEIIKLTEGTVTLHTDTPKDVGSAIDLEVKLPEGVLLESFRINGTITACNYVRHNGECNYMIQMRIGDISLTNKKILEAYIDFLEREKTLEGIRIDFKALREVFNDFGEELRRLEATAEEMTSNIRGILELIRWNAEGKITIH